MEQELKNLTQEVEELTGKIQSTVNYVHLFLLLIFCLFLLKYKYGWIGVLIVLITVLYLNRFKLYDAIKTELYHPLI